MSLRIQNSERGFSLVELTVVLLLITLLASVAVRETAELGFQTRYEQTRERLDMIRQAILGNPRQIINGQQAVSGFVADMGRLPISLRELIQVASYCTDNTKFTKADCEITSGAVWLGRKSYGFCSLSYPNETQCIANAGLWTHLFYGGWSGPYLNISGNPVDNDAFTDGWGNVANDNNYGWNFINASPDLTLQSQGKNQALNPADTDYDEDYPISQPTITAVDWLVEVSLITVNMRSNPSSISTTGTCSDTTQTNKTACLDNGKIWTESSTSATQNICLSLYYRFDNQIRRIESAATTISEDGQVHSISFSDLGSCSDALYNNKVACEINTKTWTSPLQIPVGQIAIAIHRHDGDCDAANPFYPADRQNPIQIDFHPHTILPVINW